jgi:hypothetical protein
MPSQHPDIVIRPSGVWDTRAPFFRFISEHRKENEIYHTLMLGINHLGSQINQKDINSNASDFLLSESEEYIQRRTWKSYIKSFPDTTTRIKPNPTIGQFKHSLDTSISSVTEYAVISYFGLFETYIRCWALNFLLAKLENEDKSIDTSWTTAERKLANSFSPIKKGDVPNFVHICQAIPAIKDNLEKLPHVFVDPKTGNLIEVPITPKLNAFQVIDFWRSWRNLLVHSSGMVNAKFYYKYADFWVDFKSVFSAMPDFEIGKRLVLNDWTFRAMTTVHYLASKSLRSILVELSHERRGHSLAPNPAKKDGQLSHDEIPEHLPALLIQGDHEISHQWATDVSFRDKKKIVFGENQK